MAKSLGLICLIALSMQGQEPAKGSDILKLFTNAHLKTEPWPSRKDDVHLGIAQGIWELSDGSHPLDPEQASIRCLKPDKTCTIQTTKLEVSNQGIAIQFPDSDEYAISEWSSNQIVANRGPDSITDKCHNHVLVMTFKTGEVTQTDIPTHAEGCKLSTMTNTWHLVRARYYIDTK